MGLLRVGAYLAFLASLSASGCGAELVYEEAPTCSRIAAPREGESARAANVFVEAEGAATPVGQVRSCFVEFSPAYPLWTDGKVARRWLYVPEGKQVDGSSPDHFEFPVGTRALKQYSTQDGRPIELRVVERTPDGFRMGSYVYTADGKDAYYTELGGSDTLGLTPPHKIPSSAQCNQCHGGEPGRMLAFTAVQLGRGGTPSLAEFVARGVLGLDDVAKYALPQGDDVAWRALGELHANCGHCHSDTGSEANLGMVLRLEAQSRSLAETAIYKTNVHQKLATFSSPDVRDRIVPGDPAKSGVFVRLAARGTKSDMPPIGSLVRNEALENDVSRWIQEIR